MMLDLLYQLGTREVYEKFSPLIKDNMLSSEGTTLFKALRKYYDKYPEVKEVDWTVFKGWFQFSYRKLYSITQMEVYTNVLDKLTSLVPDTSIVRDVFHTLIEEKYATNIHNKALDIVGGTNTYALEDIERDLLEYKEEVKAYYSDELDYVDLGDVGSLVAATMGTGGIDWRLECLNVSAGPLRKGHFVIIGARPDSGKTTFLVSEVVHWAKQLRDDQCVMWFNNEETGEKVGRRMLESALGWTAKQLEAEPLRAAKLYQDKYGSPSKIKQIKEKALSVREVEKKIKKWKPSVIVFDQLWKVFGFDQESFNEVSRQAMLFAWARSLAAQHGPVLTVHQLGGDAEGERFPMMKSLYGSQTAIQGEADLIIMLGKSRDPAEEAYRFLSLAKNKMGDGPRTDPKKRHARYLLKIDTDHACFIEDSEYVVV